MQPLGLGIIGLGRAFTLMLPTFALHPDVKLVAAHDPRPDAVARFKSEFKANAYDTAERLCADPAVQAVYIASPHQFHIQHVKMAAANGKHILVEKPMALTVADSLAMIGAAREKGVRLLVGHSHSYDAPYLKTREIILSGQYGPARMITALNFTDFLYRPRRPEELDTRAGGGVVFSQAAHQVDVVRLLAGSKATTVKAFVGRWDPDRPTEGAYTAQISFENGCFATLTYSGYGHFDTDEFNGWRGELGQTRDPGSYAQARRALRSITPSQEIQAKDRRAYGHSGYDAFRTSSDATHNHFGFMIVSCDSADLRPTPEEIVIYADDGRINERIAAPEIPRREVVDELYDAIVRNREPLHSGEWGLATLEACLAILQSSQIGEVIRLKHQI